MIFIYRANSRLHLRYLFTYKLSNFLSVKKTTCSNEMLSLLAFKMKSQVQQHKSSDIISRNLLTVHKCNIRKKVEESIIFFKDGNERKRIGAFFNFYEHYFKDRL